MQLRHVVTCFLVHPDRDAVLLGRRSDKVNTYPGRWAGISGSVEEDAGPLQQAYREIREETGLERSDTELQSRGRPVRFSDWKLGALWVVHPYLFRCLSPEQVRRDWEHVRFEWTDPERIPELPTVPKLWEAYRTARRSEGSSEAERVFEAVKDDREHGAEELGIWTLEGLKAAADEAAGKGPEERVRRVAAACRRALDLRPSMATVRSAALEAFAACREAEDVPAALQRLLDERERAMLAAPQAAAAELTPEVRVVTLSRSFSVLAALWEASGKVRRLVVAESRPAKEGRAAAETAASFGIETELMTDAAAAGAVREADLVLLGADSLLPDGSAVNKTGSFSLCCAARCSGARTLVVATRSKVLPKGQSPRMEEMSPEELGEPIEGVRTRNVYFERIPAELVGATVTASGPTGPAELAERAGRLSVLQRELQQGG